MLGQIACLRILGPADPEQKGPIVSFTMEGTHPHDLAQLLDRHGIAIRAGHHCAMPLHMRLGIPASARASFSMYNTTAEIDRLGVALESIRLLFRRRSTNTWRRGRPPTQRRSSRMDDPLYREEILDHYYSSPHRGHLECPDLVCDLDNPLCGDQIHLELSLGADGRIDQVRFDGHGCVISQAATSLLADRVEGATLDEVRQITPADVVKLLGVTLSPTRMKCGLLGWKALQKAVAEPGPAGE